MTQDFLDSLKKRIASERTLKESSLNAYVFNLDKLYRAMGRSGDMASLDFLEDTDAVHKALEDKKDSTKKNFYSSAVVGLMAMAKDRGVLAQHYRYKMDELKNTYLQNQRGQKKSEKQTKNWATVAELRKILRNLLKRIKQRGLFTQTEPLTPSQRDLVQMWVLGNLYIGDDSNPPLRNDYSMQVVSLAEYNDLGDDAKKKNNFLVVDGPRKKFFSLSKYKTESAYGTKRIPIGKKLNFVLNKWLKINRSGHLLVTRAGLPMRENAITKHLQKVFASTGKRIGSSMLRHIYISEKFPANLTQKEDTAALMAHSVTSQTMYAKKD